MRPLRTRLQEARGRLGIQWEVLERDYLLSWVLAGISRTQVLRDTLVFKGGTALRKCYFGDYRFSEDLDFSALEEVPRGEEMERLVREACETAVLLMDEYAPVGISCEPYIEREPHPGGQEAFVIRARFPWHSRPQTRVMIEITMDEDVILPAGWRQVIHNYGEPLNAQVKVYSLEEIVAEKLRALLQQAECSRGAVGVDHAPGITTTSGECLVPTETGWTWLDSTHCCGRSVQSEAFTSQARPISSMHKYLNT